MSEDQKQETERPAPEPADRELRQDEMENVTGGGVVTPELRSSEQNDK
jgi:hypothetical protein